jgi:hypothetical protein
VPISSPAVLTTELSSLSRGQIVNIRQGSVQLGAFKPSSLHDVSSFFRHLSIVDCQSVRFVKFECW